MTWPSTVTTAHLDSDTDSVLLARTEILATALAVNTMVAGRGTASGVASLDENGRIPAAQLPGTFTTTNTDIVLEPGSNRVQIQDVLNLNPLTVSQINALNTPVAGDAAYVSNGADGSPCLAVYNGSAWLRVVLGAAVAAA
jgi:hypothetical protein